MPVHTDTVYDTIGRVSQGKFGIDPVGAALWTPMITSSQYRPKLTFAVSRRPSPP